ncbi:MAG TPA: DinB family protein [Candidatus Eisenbacteria bacterium]|nr:DinB family protein [Candidatus Eisenbacteria bacterium]
MSESGRLADQLRKSLHGVAWYGPSWRESLEGIGAADAVRRPVAQGHTIGEIVLHVITWHEVAKRRLGGDTPPQPTPEQDFPTAAFANEGEWKAATDKLFATGNALAETIAAFPDSRLDEERGNNAGTWYHLACGMLQHDLYHLGQVGLLRRAAEKAAVS